MTNQSPESWDSKCRRAWCRYHGDKREKAVVAGEFGVKMGTLEAMLDRGKFLSRPPDELIRKQTTTMKSDETEETPQERLRRVRAQLKLVKGDG